MRKICIRIDDICENMNWEKFNRFVDILDKYDLKPLIGIVPDCKDDELNTDQRIDDYKEFLRFKKQDGWTFSMHGYEHKYVTQKGGMFPLNNYSEYVGLSYKEQYHKIQDGKKKLEAIGVDTDIFMAPAHSYDKNTVKALLENGFKYITDGYGSNPYKYEGMTYLPISMLRSLEKKGKSGITTYVVHTATMRDQDFEYYDNLIGNNRSQFVNYSEMLNIPVKNRNIFGRFAEFVAAGIKHLAGQIR